MMTVFSSTKRAIPNQVVSRCSSSSHALVMSRSVDNLNKDAPKIVSGDNPKEPTASFASSSQSIVSDSETSTLENRRKVWFAKNRGFSAFDLLRTPKKEEDAPSISSEVDRLERVSIKSGDFGGKRKKVSGYFKEIGLLVTQVSRIGEEEDQVLMLSFRTLIDLINKNDYNSLKAFLENRHCNVNDTDDENNLTVLMVASSQGKLDIVYLLLSHDATVHAKDTDDATALHHAARNGHSDVCLELLEAGAAIEATDSGGWTPMIWACYHGHTATVDCLVSRGADINARGLYNLTGLVWASGRGYYDIVELLLENNAKVDAEDKYGTTSLIWAARSGNVDICNLLIRAGANVDAVGMYSWTPLLVATKANKFEIVDQIISKGPNVNAADKDRVTPLAIACKEGYTDIALKLLGARAYVNQQDKSGDTNLIVAARGGHKAIVEALLKKYADVNIRGKDGKTCLHCAIDRNHIEIVKILLTTNPDLEIKTNEGDTALHRAVRIRNPDLVELLLEKKAKINAVNKKNDTALHIAMRARSKAVVEILLRHPKHSQLLYKPNNQGETPYNLDMSSNKSILGQMWGTRRLNTNEDGEVMLGYDLYSSALANILTEPSLAMPITVGLYAKWGSGKSFLLGKLREEMKSFTKEWKVEPTFENSALVFMVILHIACILGIFSWILSYLAIDLGAHASIVAVCIAVGIIVLTYSFIFGIMKFSRISHYASIYDLKVFLANRFNSLKLVINVIFSHPPGPDWVGASSSADQTMVRPLRLLFTDQTKVITAAGGQNSVTQMIGSLYDAIEDHYGIFATRLFRAFRPKPLKATSMSRWRKMCCLPYAYIYIVVTILTLIAVVLLVVSLEHVIEVEDGIDVTFAPTISNATNIVKNVLDTHHNDNYFQLSESEKKILVFSLVSIGIIVGTLIVANSQTFFRAIRSLLFSQRRHLQSAVAKLDVVKSEGYLQAVKGEVQLMVNMVRTLDAFTGYQTRLVVVVDGLDSCEQSRVLSVLDAVHMLFSDEGSPFVILLAIDPHVITKAIELNIHQTFRDTSIGGMAYLRNIVHLPFYLQNAGLRKVHIAQQLASTNVNRNKSSAWFEIDSSDRKMSEQEIPTSQFPRKGKAGRIRRSSITSVTSVGSRYNAGGAGPQTDITKVIATDDYMSDVNVKTMRRLMNVVYVMSRLMRAFHIDFNWNHLATWVNITEQWPYRMSWIIFYVETAAENKKVVEDSTSLWEIYTKIRASLPSHRDLEPLLDMDRDEKKLEAILSMKQRTLTVRDLKIFIPFGVNLDPYIKKVIRDEYVSLAALEGSETGFGWFNEDRNITKDVQHKQVAPRAVARKVAQANHGVKQVYPDLFTSASGGAPTSARPPQNIHPQLYPQPPSHFPYFAEPLASPSPDLSPVHLPSGITDKPLSKKNVEDVCSLLRQIDGLMPSRVDTYCDAISSQNISGAVLAHCNINELKSVLNMNFGDWEMFQLVLISLREHDRKQKRPSSLSIVRSEKQSTVSSRHNESYVTPKNSLSSKDRPKTATSAAESAINMEDALISGLLSRLNEDAHEDIITDEILEEREQPTESEAIYITRAQGGTMTQSIGSEDAFNALEKGYSSNLSVMDSNSVIALDSLPSSPSKADPTPPTFPTITTTATTTTQVFSGPRSSSRIKTKHLGDRLGGTGRSELSDEEPYAWISQTAPASPIVGRSRAGSSVAGGIDLEDDRQPIFAESSAISVGNLGDKVKKTIRHALSRIDSQPSNALPPVQRPRDVSDSAENGGFQRKGSIVSRFKRGSSRQSSINASIELPVFNLGNDEDDNEDDDDVSKDNLSPSPEQETVMPKPEQNRPHIHNVFPDTNNTEES